MLGDTCSVLNRIAFGLPIKHHLEDTLILPIEERSRSMESKLYWFVPNQVLYWKLSGDITASDISEMSRFIIDMVSKQSIQKVHLVIDALGVSQINYANRDARSEFAKLATQQWMGQVVAVVNNIQIQIHLNAMSHAFGMKWKSVPSVRKAVRTMQQGGHLDRSMTIPDLKKATPINESK